MLDFGLFGFYLLKFQDVTVYRLQSLRLFLKILTPWLKRQMNQSSIGMPREKNIIAYPQLQKILPQAYPFLMIDRVEDYIIGESLTAIEAVACCSTALDFKNT